MVGRRPRLTFFLAALVVYVASANATMYLARLAEPMLPRERYLAELAYYPSGSWLRAMSFGESALLADFTWLRAVQYYGEHRQQDNKFELLHHAFDVVTNFDPRHRNSYVFGGTSLAQEGKQFEKGESLLLKGRRSDPTSWVYPFELGFIHYVERRDYLVAGLWFQEAARKPDCPEFVKRFAAFSVQRAGHREHALELWRVVAEETNNPVLREKAIASARALAAGTRFEAAVERWAKRVAEGGGEIRSHAG
jgi:tetratricopeptide (TPR) repeat protein